MRNSGNIIHKARTADSLRMTEVTHKVYLLKTGMLPWRDVGAVQIELFFTPNALYPDWTVVSFLLICIIAYWTHSPF